MGTTCYYIDFFSSFETSDWLSLLGVIVNAILAIWIVSTIQKKLTNKRVLKDHFIYEIKEIRSEYKSCLNNLYSNNTNPRTVIPWFKLMNIKVDDLMSFVCEKYKIDKNKLKPYQIELRDLITNNDDFMKQYNEDKVFFNENSKSQIIIFQQKNNQVFNEIIVAINDAE